MKTETILSFEEIRVENTNLCPFSCFMCPRELLSRQKGTMTFENFILLAKKLTPYINSNHLRWFDLNGFGEPMLDKELVNKIQFLKTIRKDIKTRIVTTALKLGIFQAENLINAGISMITLSHYGGTKNDYKLIHGIDTFETTRNNINNLIDLNKSLGNPILIQMEKIDFKGVYSEYEHQRTEALQAWYSDIITKGVIVREPRNLHNWGNTYDFAVSKKDKICSVTNGFRKRVLQITWDGYVIPCCFDFNAEIRFGNVFEQSLEEIFNSSIYSNFIDAHLLNQLDNYSICKDCDKCLIP